MDIMHAKLFFSLCLRVAKGNQNANAMRTKQMKFPWGISFINVRKHRLHIACIQGSMEWSSEQISHNANLTFICAIKTTRKVIKLRQLMRPQCLIRRRPDGADNTAHRHTYTHAHKWKESDLEIHPSWQLAQLEMAKALGECHLNSSLNDRNTASELCRASSCSCPSPCITQQAYLIDSPLCIQSPHPYLTCPQYKQ